MKRHALLLIGLMLAQAAWADLHNPNNAADYLIVTTGALIESTPWIHDLADWRTNHGRTAMVVATDSIWNEFGDGTPSDSTLRDFLFYAYDHWSAPQLKDVFIIGWHDVVPMHIELDSMSYVDSTGQTRWRRDDFPSDLFYSWDPGSSDPFPLLQVGRWPWSLQDSVPPWNYFAKVQGYESIAGEVWQQRIQIIADNSDQSYDFPINFAEPVAARIHSGYTIERDYLDYPVGDPWHGDRDEVFTHLNDGNYMTFFLGHAGGGVWSASELLNAAGADSLSNGNRLPIVSSTGYDLGFNRGEFRLYDMAKAFLSNPNGGAIGYFGVTPLSWAYAGLELREDLAQVASSDTIPTLGAMWKSSLAEFISNHPAEIHNSGSGYRQTSYGCVLLGDPGLRLPRVNHQAAEEPQVALPYALELLGNYPNPFNPTTRILFNVGRAGQIKLSVTNILGQTVAVLGEGRYDIGQYDFQWNAQDYPSGIYFSVLESPGAVRQVRKMVLLK